MKKNTVYIKSGDVKRTLFIADSYEEAWKFCDDNNWEFKDENDFYWDLDFVE